MNTLLKWIEWNECVSPVNCKNKDIVSLMQQDRIGYFVVMAMLDLDGFFETI